MRRDPVDVAARALAEDLNLMVRGSTMRSAVTALSAVVDDGWHIVRVADDGGILSVLPNGNVLREIVEEWPA